MARRQRIRSHVAALGRCALLAVIAAAGCGLGDHADGGVACDSEGRPTHVEGTWIVTGEGERTGCTEATLDHDFKLGPATFEVVMDDPNQYDAGLPPDAGPPDDAATDGARDGGVDGGDAGAAEAGTDGGGTDGGGEAGGDGGGGDGGDGGLPDDAATSDALDAATDAPRDAGQSDAAPPIVYQPATLRLRSSIDGFDFQGRVRGQCISFETAEVVPSRGTLTYEFTGAYETFGRRVKGTFSGSGPGNCTASGTFTVELQ